MTDQIPRSLDLLLLPAAGAAISTRTNRDWNRYAPAPVLLSTDDRGVALKRVGNAYNSAMLDGLIHGLSSRRRPGRALSRSPWRRQALPGRRRHQMARRRRRLSASHRITPPRSRPPEQCSCSTNSRSRPSRSCTAPASAAASASSAASMSPSPRRIAVRDYGNSRRRRAHADLHPYGQRHRPAAYPPLRPDRRALRRREAERIGLIHEIVPRTMKWKRNWPLSSMPSSWAARPQSPRPRAASSAANNLLLDERQIAMLAHEGWTQRASSEGIEGTTAFRAEAQTAWYEPVHPNV